MISNNLIDGFISAMSNRLINTNSKVNLKTHYKDVIHVYIDDVDVGKLSDNPDDVVNKCTSKLCYFLPNSLFFDFIDKKPINDFVKVTQKLSMSFDDILDPGNPNRPQDRKLSDFGFDLRGENVYHRCKFDNKDVYFNENLSMTFKVVKHNGVVRIIDNFKTSILNINWKVLGKTEIQDLNNNINMVITKNNDNYIFTHQYEEYRPAILFDIDDIPDFEEIISFLADYTLMLKHNIELPSMIEFKKNKDRYKDLIEMVLIS